MFIPRLIVEQMELYGFNTARHLIDMEGHEYYSLFRSI